MPKKHIVCLVHSLNHHIQHRLNDIAQQHEVDRQWISNHIIQFILHPEKQKDILTLLSTTLSFTQDQKRAIGLVPSSSSSSSSVATPDTTPKIASSSLSDQWISFLLKEVHPPPPPNPTSSSSSSFSSMSIDQEKDNETERAMGGKK